MRDCPAGETSKGNHTGFLLRYRIEKLQVDRRAQRVAGDVFPAEAHPHRMSARRAA